MTEGIKAWVVLQPSAVDRRFEAIHAARLTDGRIPHLSGKTEKTLGRFRPTMTIRQQL
jgi:hypothetical protein